MGVNKPASVHRTIRPRPNPSPATTTLRPSPLRPSPAPGATIVDGIVRQLFSQGDVRYEAFSHGPQYSRPRR